MAGEMGAADGLLDTFTLNLATTMTTPLQTLPVATLPCEVLASTTLHRWASSSGPNFSLLNRCLAPVAKLAGIRFFADASFVLLVDALRHRPSIVQSLPNLSRL